jgi:hypothetical protein
MQQIVKDNNEVLKYGTKGCTHWFFSEIKAFSTSPDLPSNLGLILHLITCTCL